LATSEFHEFHEFHSLKSLKSFGPSEDAEVFSQDIETLNEVGFIETYSIKCLIQER
jgi:hypothetical protein